MFINRTKDRGAFTLFPGEKKRGWKYIFKQFLPRHARNKTGRAIQLG